MAGECSNDAEEDCDGGDERLSVFTQGCTCGSGRVRFVSDTRLELRTACMGKDADIGRGGGEAFLGWTESFLRVGRSRFLSRGGVPGERWIGKLLALKVGAAGNLILPVAYREKTRMTDLCNPAACPVSSCSKYPKSSSPRP